MTGSIELLHLDDQLVAVNKPSGLLVHRGWANDRDVAMTLVRDRLGRHVWPVHRLDRGTSGALLFALDPDTARALHEGFERGDVHKRYLAIVRGTAPEAGVVDHPIPRRPDGPRVPAVTEFRRLHVFERWSIVEALPRTGRLHQIRRHLKHVDHPIIGDVNYGSGEHNRIFRDRFALRRLALHALELSLAHPATGAPLRLRARLPPELDAAFAAMGFSLPASASE